MLCPICEGRAIVTYTARDCEMVARQRKCTECNHVFYTTELELKDSRIDYIRLVNEKHKRWRNENKIR